MIDAAIVLLILILSLKGYINGVMRELVGFVGLIGGVFVGTRAAEPVGKMLDQIWQIGNLSLSKLLAFALVLLLIWGGSTFVGSIFPALRALPHTAASRWGGMGVAAFKYLLIFSVLAASLLSSDVIHNAFASSLDRSHLAPPLKRIGRYLIHLPTPGTVQIAPAPAKGH